MPRTRKPCPQCGSTEHNPSCPRCRKRMYVQDYQTRQRAKFRELGLCRCGNESAPWRKSCPECLERARTVYKNRNNEKPPAKVPKEIPPPQRQTLLPPHLQEIIRQARRERGAYKRDKPAK